MVLSLLRCSVRIAAPRLRVVIASLFGLDFSRIRVNASSFETA